MNALGLNFLRRLDALAPLALRLGVGIVFVAYGFNKFQGPPQDTIAMLLSSEGVPAPELVGWLITIAELVGGAMLLVGLLTRLVTLPLIATMVGAIILVKAPMGIQDGAAVDIALLGGLVALLLIGPGRLSADAALGIETSRSTTTHGDHVAA